MLTSPRTDPHATIGFRENWVTIVDPRVPEELRRWSDDDAPPVRVEHDELLRTYLRPVADPPAGTSGWMASGAYVDVTDPNGWWRMLFGGGHPVPLHDLGAL